MQLEAIQSHVKDDMEAVDKIIAGRLGSEIAMIRQLGEYIFGGGGKRLRPILVILGARVFNYQGAAHHLLAAVVELIHTATLLHDDVVDSSTLRRGQKTANVIWGNQASVLVGDFLYSRAFQMMVEVGHMDVLRVLADAANTIAAGEVMQLINCKDPDISEMRYIETIQRKTATLFQAAAQLGPILCDAPLEAIDAMANYGLHVGLAFQLVDDALDYGASDTDIGKNIGDDLAEGKPTLPLLHALKHGSEADQALIRKAIAKGCLEDLDSIRQAIDSTKAIEYTYAMAKQHVDYALDAIESLPASVAKTVMQDLARFAIVRKF